MKYLKVKWQHDFNHEPILLYSELEDDRSEIRKVEVFQNSFYGYADDKQATGTTRLSDMALPLESEIAEDPQFIPETITKDEFEEAWKKATKN